MQVGLEQREQVPSDLFPISVNCPGLEEFDQLLLDRKILALVGNSKLDFSMRDLIP